MKCGDMLKIGVSKNPEKRLKTFQTSNSKTITLEWYRSRNDAFKLEKYLHRSFSEYKVRGEWFDGTKLSISRIQSESMGYIDHDWDDIF
jgi:hypothetical protein